MSAFNLLIWREPLGQEKEGKKGKVYTSNSVERRYLLRGFLVLLFTRFLSLTRLGSFHLNSVAPMRSKGIYRRFQRKAQSVVIAFLRGTFAS